MSWRKVAKLSTVAGLLSLPFLYQNCGGGFQYTDEVSGISNSSSSNSDLKSAGITCENPFVFSPSDSRRLSRLELANTLRSAVGDNLYSKVEGTVLTLSDDEIKKDPKLFQTSFDSAQMEIIDRISRQMGSAVIATDDALKSVAGSCAATANIADDCVKAFIKSFGKKTLRRPLSDSDLQFYQSVYSATGSGKAGIAGVVSAMMLAPEFLYHIETGEADSSSNSQYGLTNYEVANRISYLLTDSPPDQELTSKADSGTLRERLTLSAQVDRLLNSPAGKNKVMRFFSYWLMLDTFQGFPTNKNYLDGIDPNGLSSEMTRELYEFINYIVYVKRGNYQDLLTSKKSFARTPALASIYGHSPVTGTEPAEVGNSRMGIFLRSPILANGTNQTHPILRGVFMLRRALCIDIPSPGPDDLAQRTMAGFVADPLHDSTAVTTAKQTSPASCMGCHSSINPLGFSLEGYDNLGRARTVDKIFDANGNFIAQHPVQISEPVSFGRDTPVRISSGPELMAGLAGSVIGPACMTKQIHRFYKMQRELETDGCLLAGTYNSLQEPSGSIYSAIKNSIVNAYTDKKRIQ